MRPFVLLAAAVVLALASVGCGDDGGGEDGVAAAAAPARTDRDRTPAPRHSTSTRSRTAHARPLERARCPAGLAGCRSVLGRVVYVESVDPDGDGDLHVVVVGGGVTAPGITAIDVARGLRPRHDPRLGQRVTAAGQVQRGSYGQRQIHASIFAVQR